jgi:hypothetical protein
VGRSEYPLGDIGHRHRQEESGVEPLVEEENAAVDSDTLNEEKQASKRAKISSNELLRLFYIVWTGPNNNFLFFIEIGYGT